MKYDIYTGPKLKTDIILGLGSDHPVSRDSFCLLGGAREKQALPESCQAFEDPAVQTSACSTKTLINRRISSDVIVYMFPH